MTLSSGDALSAAVSRIKADCLLNQFADILRAPFDAQLAAIIGWLRADRGSTGSPATERSLPIPSSGEKPGVLSGTLARTQGYGTEQRRRVLNDALLFATARKHGCAVLSRNVRDFDLLQQLDPAGKVLFYKTGAL
jgi:predicted nucleic acid-binding protein